VNRGNERNVAESKISRLQDCNRPLLVVSRAVSELHLNPQNPRQHSRQHIKQVARSIEEFGFIVPVLIDASRQLIAGHGRVLAAQHLGMTEVPTITVDLLTETQRRAFLLADNRLAEVSTWDRKLLGDQFKILAAAELDFSLELTGFEMSQIDLFIEGAVPDSAQQVDSANEIPEIPTKPCITRAGDCWVLGRHRVLCGDAETESTFSSLMQGRRAEMVFVNPPYNDPIDHNVSGFGRIHHPESLIGSGEMSSSQFTEFLTNVLSQLARNSIDGALQFVCMDWRHSFELLSAARNAYTEFKNLCVWTKDCPGQGSLYRSAHELVFVFKSGKKPHRNNIKLGGRYRTNVWRYARVNGPSRPTDEAGIAELHPTVKPVELVADAILDCTARRDLVLDVFLGSGTTVIASERTGRTCYGMDLDPNYVDVAVRRWEKFTGQDAVNEITGHTFKKTELEVNRGQQ